MTSHYNINPDGAHDGHQRSLEDFQFDLENVLTMSQLVGKRGEERNAASVMLDIPRTRLQQRSSQKRRESVEKVIVRSACSEHCWTSQSDFA